MAKSAAAAFCSIHESFATSKHQRPRRWRLVASFGESAAARSKCSRTTNEFLIDADVPANEPDSLSRIAYHLCAAPISGTSSSARSACLSASKTSAFFVSLVFSASALFFIARASRQLSSPASAEPGFALLSSACSSAVSSEYLAASKSASAFASVRASHDAGAVASVAAAAAAAAAAAMVPTRRFCATSFSEG